MEKLFICVDNKTPGAIIGQIVKFLLPSCSIDGMEDIILLSTVNKYFKKVIDHIKCPRIRKLILCDLVVCKKCTPDYRQLKKLEFALIAATQDQHKGWMHFDSREMTNRYEPIVRKYFSIKGRCCGGKGLAIR